MNTTKIVMVTSCKGGVGKSTVAANLGIRLACDGWRTLIIDCDFGVRSLDLIMGLEDEVIFDITDVILRGIAPDKASIRDRRSENLFFCSAPYAGFAPGESGSPAFLPSGMEPVALPYTTFDVIVRIEVVGIALR